MTDALIDRARELADKAVGDTRCYDNAGSCHTEYLLQECGGTLRALIARLEAAEKVLEWLETTPHAKAVSHPVHAWRVLRDAKEGT